MTTDPQQRRAISSWLKERGMLAGSSFLLLSLLAPFLVLYGSHTISSHQKFTMVIASFTFLLLAVVASPRVLELATTTETERVQEKLPDAGHARRSLNKEACAGNATRAEEPLAQDEAPPPEDMVLQPGPLEGDHVLEVVDEDLLVIENVVPLPILVHSPRAAPLELEPTRPNTPEEEDDGDIACGPWITQSLPNLPSPNSEPSTPIPRASSLGLEFDYTPEEVVPEEPQELPIPESPASYVRVGIANQWTWEGGDLEGMRRTYEARVRSDKDDIVRTTSNGGATEAEAEDAGTPTLAVEEEDLNVETPRRGAQRDLENFDIPVVDQDAALSVQKTTEVESSTSTRRNPNIVWLGLLPGETNPWKQFMADEAFKTRERKRGKEAAEEAKRGAGR